ncbi:large-conductance mechanosensitive channel [Pedobacter sp. UYP30]|uniref:DUF3810 domain-containing protein n=1 Tax=Pedobacter sp. UYP30 TaxID=1756400 RepID=UPI003391AA2C
MTILKKLFVKFTILFGLAILIYIFGSFPNLVETYYSTVIYPFISVALRFFSSLFPFAIGDVVYGVLIAFILHHIVRFFQKLRRKQFKKSDRVIIPLKVFNFLLILYIAFKLVWGLNYTRVSVSKTLGIGDEKYNVKELVLLGNYLINQTNILKAKVDSLGKTAPLSIKDLQKESAGAYQFMAKKNEVFKYPQPCLKKVLFPWAVSKAGIEGYYAPLTGEANLNYNLPEFVKPYVSCHEIAHQLGIAYEDEANLLGYLAAINSKDVRYKYSANYEMLRYVLIEIALKSPEDYNALHDKLSAGVLADFKTEKEFWAKYNGAMFGYLDAAFDGFLKANNQAKGIDSYQDIVIWLWNIHKGGLHVVS